MVHRETPTSLSVGPIAPPASTKPSSNGSHSQQEAKVTVQDLVAWYGNFQALKPINLSFLPLQVTALIGPSGCGKSTFIRCLNRMHETARKARVDGSVIVNGQNIYDPEVDPVMVRRRIGMVFQKPNPFPTMSIYDNVAAGLKLNGLAKSSELDEVVEQALRDAALWDEVKDKLKQGGAALSGGQQQRLCIARVLAVKPDIILMDEPCSALDPIATQRIEDLIEQLKNDYTVIIVTHNMQQAVRVSQYTAFFLAGEDGAGELVEEGDTNQVFGQPKDHRTESYITGRFG